MFGWRKRKEPESDRDANVRQCREIMTAIRTKWDVPTKMTFAVLLATLWRRFEQSYGTANAFAGLKVDAQNAYLLDLLQRAKQADGEAQRLVEQRAAQGNVWDTLCQMAAARLMAIYVVCLIENDRELERELAPFLEEYMSTGYQISMSSFPMPGDEKHFPIDGHGPKPLASFVR